jgi:hypothetical protein
MHMAGAVLLGVLQGQYRIYERIIFNCTEKTRILLFLNCIRVKLFHSKDCINLYEYRNGLSCRLDGRTSIPRRDTSTPRSRHPHNQWLLGIISLGLKCPECEAHESLLSVPEFKFFFCLSHLAL